jgi:hypothetical protein
MNIFVFIIILKYLFSIIIINQNNLLKKIININKIYIFLYKNIKKNISKRIG